MAKAYKGIAPCRECKKRTVGCHAKCKEYQSWKDNGVEIPSQFYEKIKRNKKRW